MRLRVLVDDDGAWRDVVVDVAVGQTLDDLASALGAHLGRTGCPRLGRGAPPGPALDPTTTVGDSGIRQGERLTLLGDDAEELPAVPVRRLVVQSGPDAGGALQLSPGSHTVGRGDTADLVVVDAHLSREHVRVTARSTGVEVEDLGSSNGTRVAGQGVTAGPARLGTGSVIVAGASLFELRPPPPPQRAVPTTDGVASPVRGPRTPPAVPEPTVELRGTGPSHRRRRLLRRTQPADTPRAPHHRTMVAHALHPDPLTLVERACHLHPRLWERRPGDDDFLDLRVGWSGADPDGVPVPVVLDLARAGTVGVCCTDDRLRRAMLRWHAGQLAGLCSPTELQVLPVLAGEEAWTSWLRHLPTPTAGVPALAAVVADLRSGRRRERPLVVVADAHGPGGSETLDLLADGPALGVHVVLGARRRGDLPPTGAAVTVDATTGRGTCEDGDGRARLDGADGIRGAVALDLAAALAGVGSPSTVAATSEAPSLLELLGARRPRPDRVRQWWAEAGRPIVIGTTSTGAVHLEVGPGSPHVVVACDQPAARQALLRTIAAATAANRGPDQVQLLLVDPAGSGAFTGLAPLPHCRAGTGSDPSAAADVVRAQLLRQRPPHLVLVLDDAAAAPPPLHRVLDDVAAAEPGQGGITVVLGTERLEQGLRLPSAVRLVATTNAASSPVWHVVDEDRRRAVRPAGIEGRTVRTDDTQTIEVRDVVDGRPTSGRSTIRNVVEAQEDGATDLALLVDACRRAAPATPVPGPHAAEPVRVERTFVFTDVVRSTALVEAIGDEHWTRLLQWHDEVVTGLAATHGGEVVDHTGDGFFLAFRRPAPAVTFGLELQQLLRRHRRAAGFAPEVRIGVHHTQAHHDGRYRGRGVHVAARIAALAEGGEVLASAATLEHVPDVATGATRTAELRGISTPVPIASVTLPDGGAGRP